MHDAILWLAIQGSTGQAMPTGGSAHAGLEYFSAGLASGCALNPESSPAQAENAPREWPLDTSSISWRMKGVAACVSWE